MKLQTLLRRLHSIGIYIELWGNFPWIYIHTINYKSVTEKYCSDHGYVVAYNIGEIELINSKELFKLIRKYVKA